MKRIKKVFTNYSQVIHLWANQSQNEANTRNVFFTGDTIYSYGYHYKLGKIHKINNISLAVINSRRVSMSTGRHINEAKFATRHLLTLESTNVDSIETALIETQEILFNSLFTIFKEIKFAENDKIVDDYRIENIKYFNKLCSVIDRPDMMLNIDTDFLNLLQNHIDFRIKRTIELNSPEELAKKAKKAEKLELKRIEKAQSDIKAWREGGAITKAVRDLNHQLIRINGDVVETSRGARVPLSDAKRLLNRILNKEAQEGDNVGMFHLSSIKESIVRIGCHTIELNEARQVLSEKL